MGDPQRWNRYGYVRNDPLRLVDPDGLDATIIYTAGGLSGGLADWFAKNKDAILAAISQKLRDVGVNAVNTISASDLSPEERNRLSSAKYKKDERQSGTPGVVRLEFDEGSTAWAPGEAPSGVYGLTNGGRSAVFLQRLLGLNATEGGSSSCDAVCAVANVAAHEVGHAFGFDDPGHNIFNYLPLGLAFAPPWPSEWGRDDVMKQGGDPFARPLPYRRDTNIKAVDEVNRVKFP